MNVVGSKCPERDGEQEAMEDAVYAAMKLKFKEADERQRQGMDWIRGEINELRDNNEQMSEELRVLNEGTEQLSAALNDLDVKLHNARAFNEVMKEYLATTAQMREATV